MHVHHLFTAAMSETESKAVSSENLAAEFVEVKLQAMARVVPSSCRLH